MTMRTFPDKLECLGDRTTIHVELRERERERARGRQILRCGEEEGTDREREAGNGGPSNHRLSFSLWRFVFRSSALPLPALSLSLSLLLPSLLPLSNPSLSLSPRKNTSCFLHLSLPKHCIALVLDSIDRFRLTWIEITSRSRDG